MQLGLDRVSGGAAANNVLQPKVVEACLGETAGSSCWLRVCQGAQRATAGATGCLLPA